VCIGPGRLFYGVNRPFDSHFVSMSFGPRIVFDEEPDSDSDVEPILLRFRQPSFTRLSGTPIPKGFDSVSEFRQKKVLIPFMSHLDSSLQSSFSIHDVLSYRNAPKWKELGYDPKMANRKQRRETCPDLFAPYPIPGSPGRLSAERDRASET